MGNSEGTKSEPKVILIECPKCGQPKPLTEFYADRFGVDGHSVTCKQCTPFDQVARYQQNEYARRSYLKNKEKRKQNQKDWRQGEGRATKNAHTQKYYAQAKGATEAELIPIAELYERDKGVCQLCNLPCTTQDASVDHKTPISRGGQHTWENVQLTHLTCNIWKSNMTMEEWQQRANQR